jgi:hypothetical protein
MGQKGVNETGDLLPRRVSETARARLLRKKRKRRAARGLARKR